MPQEENGSLFHSLVFLRQREGLRVEPGVWSSPRIIGFKDGWAEGS